MYVPLFFVGLSLMVATASGQVDGYPDCVVQYPDSIGDGLCENDYNTEACGYDGGDCCECDCKDGDYPCGASFLYNCIDPNSNCPSECSNGLEGFEGTNENGSVCCPLGCNQCGGAGCGQSGAGQGYDHTDCCINGVLNSYDGQKLCSVIPAAPCIMDGLPVPPVPQCVTGIDGYLGVNGDDAVCCPVECTTCGGAGCGTVGAPYGLDNTHCCINGVINNQDWCANVAEAPCILEA